MCFSDLSGCSLIGLASSFAIAIGENSSADEVSTLAAFFLLLVIIYLLLLLRRLWKILLIVIHIIWEKIIFVISSFIKPLI